MPTDEEGQRLGKRSSPAPALRDGLGRWLAGQTGNAAGRPPVLVEVRLLAREHTAMSIRVLAEIADDPAAHPLVRVAATRELLDRGHGRPVPAAAELDVSDLSRLSDEQLGQVERIERAGRAVGRRWAWRGPAPAVRLRGR